MVNEPTDKSILTLQADTVQQQESTVDNSTIDAIARQQSESESTIRALLDATFDAAFILTAQGEILAANAAVAAGIGQAMADILGRRITDFLPPEMGELRMAWVREAMQSGEPAHHDDARDGRFVDFWIRPISDADGCFTRCAVFVRETTDANAKEAEAALRASEEHAREHWAEIDAIYHTAPVGLCIFDRELRYVRINERLAEINGMPAADHIGRTVREVLPEVADVVEAALRRVIEMGEPMHDVEFSGMTPAAPGVLRTWVEQWMPLCDELGHVIGINVVAEEVTARKQAEEALCQSEERFRLAANAVNSLVYDWDLRTDTVFRSEGAERLIGIPAQDIPPDRTWWSERIHTDDLARLANMDGYTIGADSLQDAFSTEYRVRHADGHWVCLGSWISGAGSRGKAGTDYRLDGRHLRLEGDQPCQGRIPGRTLP